MFLAIGKRFYQIVDFNKLDNWVTLIKKTFFQPLGEMGFFESLQRFEATRPNLQIMSDGRTGRNVWNQPLLLIIHHAFLNK